jgi:hypothetical protein
MYNAGTVDALNRHVNAPDISASHTKPLPYTVTGVPLSTTPCAGDSDETAAVGR